MAAVLPNPQRLRIDAPSRYVLRRQGTIEAQMRALGGTDYLSKL
jgi:monofunctional biosynthetic peptidoglycan transglycosylase